jgi:hypothetical protein
VRSRNTLALAEQVRKIGVLMGMDAGDPVGESEVRALKQGLLAENV